MLKNKTATAQPRTPEQEIAHWRKQYALSRHEVHDLSVENDGLREVIREKGYRVPWDLAKVPRQRAALDRLHTRVVAQRFQLRTLNGLGRGLTRDEFLAAREEEQNAQSRERIGDYPDTL